MLLSATAIGAVTEILDADDFYRESHGIDLPSRARALRQGRAGRRDHARERARRAERARAHRRHGEARRARRGRAGDLERRALRAHRQGDGDAARPRARRSGDPAARPEPPRRDDRPRRPRRADGVRARAGACQRRLRPHPRPAQRELRADHASLRGGSRHHRRPLRLPRARQAHVGVPARQPDHRRGPAVDGEVGARALHRRQPRRPPRDAGRALHARDVEGGGDAAPHVQRGEGGVAAAPLGPPRPGRLAAADGGVRQADEGADLRRRHGLDHDDGAPLQGAAAEVPGAEAGDDHRRLPAADDLRLEPGEPRAGGVADLAAAEGARARPRGPDPRSLAAVARRRAAPRQAADPLRPARVRLDRAGRRPRRLRLPRRVLQRRGVRLAGPRRGDPRQAPQRPHRRDQAQLPQALREVHGSGRDGGRRDAASGGALGSQRRRLAVRADGRSARRPSRLRPARARPPRSRPRRAARAWRRPRAG